MTKKENKKEFNGQVMSKYAAKRAARVAAYKEQYAKTEVKEEDENPQEVATKEKGLKKPYYARFTPDHVYNLYCLVANNAEIRRFTALGIINWMKQKNMITGEKNYVRFQVDKFTVISDRLGRDYRYNETFFLNALVAAFSSFSASAQKVIDKFCAEEMDSSINKEVNASEVEEIVASVEKNQEVLEPEFEPEV